MRVSVLSIVYYHLYAPLVVMSWHGRRLGLALACAIRYLLVGIKIALAGDIYVLSKCSVFFKLNTEDVLKVVYAYPGSPSASP